MWIETTDKEETLFIKVASLDFIKKSGNKTLYFYIGTRDPRHMCYNSEQDRNKEYQRIVDILNGMKQDNSQEIKP